MTEVAERYARVADGFAACVAGIADLAWTGLTPCAEWTVRDLVGHVVSVHRHVAGGMHAPELPAPATDPDLREAWAVATAEMRGALADPARARAPVGGRFAPMPFEDLVGRLLCIDTLVHTWDLARATGQPEGLDPVAVTVAFDAIRPADDAIRGAGGYGRKLEPPPRADEQTRFL